MRHIFLILLLLPVLALSQRQEQFGGRSMERLESLKKVRLLEAMKLDEEKGLKLISRYNDHRNQIREMERTRMSIIEKLEKNIAAGVTDAEFQKSFNELSVVEKNIADTRAKYVNELKEVLTHKQIAEYLVFERNFAREIRNVFKEEQKKRIEKQR
jgi:hypothetical protein